MIRRRYGLIGHPLSHSFSPGIFREIFDHYQITDAEYLLFPLVRPEELLDLVEDDPSIVGFNVTIPYKERILAILDHLESEAREIGAVNCIRVMRKTGSTALKGYNTDSRAFEDAISPLLEAHHRQALLLGTGGAARAVAHALCRLNIPWTSISRTPDMHEVSYEDLDGLDLEDYPIIINTTPLGMHPDVLSCPNIPYHRLTKTHLLFDLVYNPDKTEFMSRGERQGAKVTNGMRMLRRQAELSWEIWSGAED